jgi:hypothetical protein
MNQLNVQIFTGRSTVTIDLPSVSHVGLLYPEQVVLKVGKRYYDLGAFCYLVRENAKHRCHSRKVVISSFLESRPCKILLIIEFLLGLSVDMGRRKATVQAYVNWLKLFLDWTDSIGMYDCLDGGEGTLRSYYAWKEALVERYRRQEIKATTYNHGIRHIRALLKCAAGDEDFIPEVPKVEAQGEPVGSTEPLSSHEFAHAVALNQALFDGICELVLENQNFPYKLLMPRTLGWKASHLWVFPVVVWRLPPHLWGAEREKLNSPYWPYDYANGRLATPEEIAPRYSSRLASRRIKDARNTVALSRARLITANNDEQHWARRMLAMVAHDAFLFLFFCNTGANESVVREIEVSGEITTTALNQKFRSIKFRAGSKQVTIVLPVAFMPSFRRFISLRKYLFGDKSFPYLFFTLNTKVKGGAANQIRSGSLDSFYTRVLLFIDPALPRMGSRKLRASVADWYQRHHDASVTAKVLQNSEQTVQTHYDAGSVTDHHDEMSIFLNSVSEAAKRQRIVAKSDLAATRSLEEGGGCIDFGHPEAVVNDPPVAPNCKNSSGCLFCKHRVLIASYEDALKISSAAFVMEQLIFGPEHEAALRPLITKCYEDLEKIAAFDENRAMVELVRADVFERGNLTPFFTDKYQFFLELGVIT